MRNKIISYILLFIFFISSSPTISTAELHRTEYYGSTQKNLEIAARRINYYFSIDYISKNRGFSYLSAMNYFIDNYWAYPYDGRKGAGACELSTLLYRTILNFENQYKGIVYKFRDKNGDEHYSGTFFYIKKLNHYPADIASKMLMPDLILILYDSPDVDWNRDLKITVKSSAPIDLQFKIFVGEDDNGNFYGNLVSSYTDEELYKLAEYINYYSNRNILQ